MTEEIHHLERISCEFHFIGSNDIGFTIRSIHTGRPWMSGPGIDITADANAIENKYDFDEFEANIDRMLWAIHKRMKKEIMDEVRPKVASNMI